MIDAKYIEASDDLRLASRKIVLWLTDQDLLGVGVEGRRKTGGGVFGATSQKENGMFRYHHSIVMAHLRSELRAKRLPMVLSLALIPLGSVGAFMYAHGHHSPDPAGVAGAIAFAFALIFSTWFAVSSARLLSPNRPKKLTGLDGVVCGVVTFVVALAVSLALAYTTYLANGGAIAAMVNERPIGLAGMVARASAGWFGDVFLLAAIWWSIKDAWKASPRRCYALLGLLTAIGSVALTTSMIV